MQSGFTHSIGFIQGRLSPKPPDRIQAFPKDSWREEFAHAAKLGFDCIELIYDDLYLEQNPLASEAGLSEINKLSEMHKIKIGSICADYFMQKPLESHKEVASNLLKISKKINCPLVEFPFVDSSSLKRNKNLTSLVEVIKSLSKEAKELNLRIALETDLAPVEFKEFLEQFPENVGANLDLGNSAALGYDVRAECHAYGRRIFNVHVKDRVLGGTTVPLLTGNTDFDRAFLALAGCEYRGDLILQTAPDADYLGIAKKYQVMTRDWARQL